MRKRRMPHFRIRAVERVVTRLQPPQLAVSEFRRCGPLRRNTQLPLLGEQARQRSVLGKQKAPVIPPPPHPYRLPNTREQKAECSGSIALPLKSVC